jgi:hypothetical protein
MLLPPSMSTREKRQVCISENTMGFMTRWHERCMILASPCNGCLVPVHVLGLRLCNGVHFSLVLEVVPLGLLLSNEDMVLLNVGWIAIVALVSRWSRLVLAVLVPLAFSRLL